MANEGIRRAETTETIHRYYVDEAGDLTISDRRGRLTVGRPGVSKLFMVGVAYLPSPALAQEYVSGLRESLLNDLYFRGVPSMQPKAGKTALFFHAKDDVAEVRREVFALLPRLKAKVQVAIRRKHDLIEQLGPARRKIGTTLPEGPTYDDLVKRLFKGMLHKADENRIVFAQRGKGARSEALMKAIARAKRNFEVKHGIRSNKPTRIHLAQPADHVGLQIVDYYTVGATTNVRARRRSILQSCSLGLSVDHGFGRHAKQTVR